MLNGLSKVIPIQKIKSKIPISSSENKFWRIKYEFFKFVIIVVAAYKQFYQSLFFEFPLTPIIIY